MKREILKEDIELIREGLSDFEAYDFARDVQSRMEKLGFSAPALGARCRVSHTIVDKWRQGRARPNGEERMKELGMALSMGAGELDAFLYRNGYPGLYAKNPLDGACKLLLMDGAGRADIVDMYREVIGRLGLSDYAPPREIAPLSTRVMSRALSKAAQEGQLSGWFRDFAENFAGGAKVQAPDLCIIRYILLYLGDASIYEMAVAGELPVTLRNLLYPLMAGRAVNVRGLREKLIAFGLCCNMTEEEIDVLLDCAKLRPLSHTETTLDFVVLSALRCAHARYPHYEADGLARVAGRLSGSQDPFDLMLLSDYRERLASARQRADYYDSRPRGDLETRFEQLYTDYSGRGVMDYMRDVLALLSEEGDEISPDQAKPILDLLQRTQEGTSIWN